MPATLVNIRTSLNNKRLKFFWPHWRIKLILHKVHEDFIEALICYENVFISKCRFCGKHEIKYKGKLLIRRHLKYLNFTDK